MRLSDWARLNGVHPKTAYRWWRARTLPVPARQINARMILVDVPMPTAADEVERPSVVAVYARVSSHDQKSDLDRQVARLVTWCAGQGLAVARVESEIGSGVNGNRTRLRRLLSDPDVTMIVVEHRDRLGRMNTELVDAALAAHGRSILVVDDTELDGDLVRDMTEVLTSFCARLYGRRSASRRAERALAAAGTAEDSK